MEIATRPRPRRLRRWSARLAVGAVVLSVGLLLPASLGLSSHVVTDGAMGGSLARGSLVFERPSQGPDQLRVGDVITFPQPGAPEARITRRIVSIDGSRVLTHGDASTTDDTWVLDGGTLRPSRTVFAIPLVGYPELLVPWLTWPAVASLLALAAVVAHAVGRTRVVRAGSARRTAAADASVMA